MKLKRIAILGASGHGKVLADTALACGWVEIIFFDDAWPSLTKNSHWPVLGNTKILIDRVADFDGVIVAIGNNQVRVEKTRILKKVGAKLISLIHPKSIISPFSLLGVGSFIGAGAVVQIDVEIGDACIVNTNAVVEHDCVIGDGVHISPSCTLAGGVIVLDNTWLGMGANIKQLITVGGNVIVGAGSVVVRDVSNDLIIVGNPARKLVKNKC
jgi:sugar O-acyltransferase (sialic acid O-acetyltransferase NeuD family)